MKYSQVGIKKGKYLYEGKPTYDIYIKLDRKGKLLWSNIGVAFVSERLALVIDGKYYHSFYPEKFVDFKTDWVLLTQTVDEETAKGLEKFGKLNYKYFQNEK